MSKRVKVGRGRPKADLDLEKLQTLCEINCTLDEIAAAFGVHKMTIIRRQQEEPEFAAIIEAGRANFRVSVRRQQLALLMAGNATMGVWLGKQYLGQRDQMKIEASGPNDGPIAVLDAGKLATLDDETLGKLIATLGGLAAATAIGAGAPPQE
ncbi:MAG TPA: hypothetical protein DEQ40_19090 [Oxalobacteraceae bacterium]|jgi:precorrin-4 methylase|nr:hypothetical protein [Oxalobacteraceae bacterium]